MATPAARGAEASTEAVAGRVEAVRRRIGEACRRAGRDPAGVTLVAASKTQPPAKIAAAHAAGVTVFGENRVQEAGSKIGELPATIDWHLIGPLQSNKSKPAAELFSTVHSIGRLKIARYLDREAGRLGKTLTGFIEVNVGEEETKHGFLPSALESEETAPLADLEHLSIVGLMAIPPLVEDPEQARRWFRRLRQLRDRLAERPRWRGFAGLLSMGMSGDFEVAIEEGATHVRVGTALFGPREG